MANPSTLSRAFISALKLGDRPAYRVAWAAGIHPATLSKIVTGAERVKPNDPRVIAVGRELGLTPEQCFAQDAAEAGSHVA